MYLLDGADAGEDVGLLPVEDVPDLLGGHEVLVDLLLDGGQPATDHLQQHSFRVASCRVESRRQGKSIQQQYFQNKIALPYACMYAVASVAAAVNRIKK